MNVAGHKRTYDLTKDNYCLYFIRIFLFSVTHTVIMKVLNEI